MLEFAGKVVSYLEAHLDAFLAAGVIIAAFTAIFTSWWAARAAHRSMVAQMRERWIESLRSEVAQLKGLSTVQKRKEVDPDFDFAAYIHEIQVIGNRIVLRLNPNNPAHKRLETAVIRYPQSNDQKDLDKAGDELVAAAREVIRLTWEKAERGET